MTRLRSCVPWLLAAWLLRFAAYRAHQHAERILVPRPVDAYLWLLFHRSWDIVAFLAVLFAAAPLSVSVCLLRQRRGPLDAAGIALTHAATWLAAQLAVFGLLLAVRATTQAGLLAGQLVLLVLGIAVYRRVRRTANEVWRHDSVGQTFLSAQVQGQTFLSAQVQGQTGMSALPWSLFLGYVAVVAVLTTGGFYSVYLGQDYSCDLRSYHYYNAYAFLHDRLRFDYVVADQQTFFNPLADVPFYLLVQHLRPVWVGFALGALHSLAAVLLFALAYRLLGRVAILAPCHAPLAVLCAVAGFYEPVMLAEFGLTLNDNLLSLFILAAVYCLIEALPEPGNDSTPRRRLLVLAGLWLGFAVGLKLTFATFGVGAVAALLLVGGAWRQRLSAAVCFVAGSLGGFLAVEGYWAWTLYRAFGNPLFPFYNTRFQSPYSGHHDWTYPDPHPENWIERVFYPFVLNTWQGKTLGVSFQDVRLALVFVLILVTGLVALIRMWSSRSARREDRSRSERTTPRAVAFLAVFCTAAYLVWLARFHVIRYFCAGQMLLPLLAVVLLAGLLRHRLWSVAAGALSCFLILGAVRVGDFGHKLWMDRFFETQVPSLEDSSNTLVLMSCQLEKEPLFYHPFGFLVPAFPRETRFVRLDAMMLREPSRMRDEVAAVLRDHDGPIYLLTHAGTPERPRPDPFALAAGWMQEHGLYAEPDTCACLSGYCYDLGLWRVHRRGAIPDLSARR